MAGKTNLTATLFAQKKLLAKTSTGVHRADNQEPLPSSVQVGASTIFSQDIPTAPTTTSFTVQSASNGGPATVEYVEFTLVEVTGSTYDANSFDPDAVAQTSGPHTYRLALTGTYQANSNNPRRGSWPYVDDQILHWSLGGLQLVPPTFSNDIPNPYTLTIYSGSRDVDDQIPLLDELDWQIDYYSGILFLQDYDPTKIPTRAKGFIYVGEMLSASLGGGAGSGTGVGWIAPSNGSITTTGSLLVGTSTSSPSSAEISFSSAGAAVFNEQGRDADFRVEAVGKPNAIKVDANTKQVLILSGGASDSFNEALGEDVNFYVSGSTGLRGTSERSISLFGGDLHISGNLTVGGTSPGGGGGGSGTGVGWVGTSPGQIDTTGSLGVSGSLFVGEYIRHIGDDNTYLRFQSDDINLQVGGRSFLKLKEETSLDQVLILSGGSSLSEDPKNFTDTTFFVSGAIGSKYSSSPGVSVFGGDTSISGTLWGTNQSYAHLGAPDALIVKTGPYVGLEFVGGPSTFVGRTNYDAGVQLSQQNASDHFLFISGSINSRGTSVPGASVFGGDVVVSGTLSINRAQAGVGSSVTITSDGKVGIGSDSPAYKLSVGGNMDVGEYIYHKNDANTYIRFQEDQLDITAGGDSMIKMKEDSSNQVLILSGGSGDSPDAVNFTDTNFFVSGAIGSIGTSVAGTSVFGGDVVISGTLQGGSPLRIDGGMEVTGTMELKPSSGGVAIVRNPHGPVKLFASSSLKLGSQTGLIDLIDLDDGAAGALWLTGSGGLSNRSISLNTPGTLFFTGSSGGARFKGQILANDGLSGSLTRLTDGSSYIIAGANITVASSSNGAITIGAAGGGGVSFTGGVGNNNQMITADGSGNIVAESNITFNGSQLEVTGSILPGSDSLYNLGSETARFANIYTGDLHLKNERGHWQIIEEKDALTVTNRLTGKRYKMVLEPYEKDKKYE